MEDNKRKLYDALSAEYDLGTFEQFSTDIQDADKRKKLYDATINDYDFGDFDSFSNQLGFGSTQVEQPQVEEPYVSMGAYRPSFVPKVEDTPVPMRSPQKETKRKPTITGGRFDYEIGDVTKGVNDIAFDRLSGRVQPETPAWMRPTPAAVEEKLQEGSLENQIAKAIENPVALSVKNPMLRNIVAQSLPTEETGPTRASVAKQGEIERNAWRSIGGDKAVELYDAIAKDVKSERRAAMERNAEASIAQQAEEDAERLGFWGSVGQGFEQIGYGIEYLAGSLAAGASKKIQGDSDIPYRNMLEEWENFVDEGGHMRSDVDLRLSGLYDRYDEDVVRSYYTTISNLMRKHRDPLEVKAYLREMAKKYNNFGSEWMRDAEKGFDSAKPTSGFIADLIPSAAGTVLSAVVSYVSPPAGAALAKTWFGAQGAAAAGQALHDAHTSGASDAEALSSAALSTLVEYWSEKIPFDKMTKNLVRGNASKILADAVDKVGKENLQKDLFKLASKATIDGKAISGSVFKEWLANAGAEAASEAVAEGLQAVIPMIYQNPEDYPALTEVLNSMLQGAAGGFLIGGAVSPIFKFAENKQARARRREQGYLNVALVDIDGKRQVGELVDSKHILIDGVIRELDPKQIVTKAKIDNKAYQQGKIEAYKEQGYSQEPTGVNSIVALTEYEAAENEVRRVLGLTPDDDIENVVAQMGELNDDAADALEDYRRKKAVFDGVKQKFRDTVTKQYAEAENSIDRMVNKDNPSMVYSTMLDGQMVYITGGNVVLREDNTIDIDQSSDLYVTYPNNQVKTVRANKFASPVKVESAEALKAARKAEIDAQWQSEFDSAEISAEEQQKRDKGLLFSMTDKDGQHTIEIVSEGEDMSKVLIDGNPTEIPTTLLNQFREEAGIQTESGEVKGENGNVQTESAVVDDATDNVAPTGDNVAPVAPKTALEQIPRNEKNVPLYEQVDSELAWDGVVEEAGGNEETAMVAVNSMVEDKKKALAAAEKAKTKGGVTITEKIAAENERVANIEKAKADLAKWEEIAGVKAKRALAAENMAQPTVETAPVVEETQAPVVENSNVKAENGNVVETPQPANEMQPVSETVAPIEAENKPVVETLSTEEVRNEESPGITFEEYDDAEYFIHAVESKDPTLLQEYLDNFPEGAYRDGARAVMWMNENGRSQEDMRAYIVAVGEARKVIRGYNRQQTNKPAVELTEDVKTEDVNQSENNLEMVAEGGNAPSQSGVLLSDEVDENGRQFVLNSKGEIAFGEIAEDTGLTPAPILLSEGLITNPATNDGYGLVHIEARHGDQIRNAGYNSVVEFVEEVAKNYEVIREGKDRDGHQTYMLQLTDKHNNTLMVELSGDGTYWNINTAGIFKTSYGKNRKEVYNRHTTAKQPTETVEASQDAEQSGTQATSSMNAPTTSSASEDRNSVSNSQENTQKSDETAENESGKIYSPEELAEKQKQQARFADHAKGIAEKLGVEVTVHTDASTVANRDAMKAIAEGDVVKGWYNPNTGEIALFLPAMEGMRDVESTILHEAVAHYGIKHFLGKEDFDKFLDSVWNMMPTALRAHYLQYVGADMKNPSQEKMRQAADEYVAHIAEKMDLNELEKNVWNKLIDLILDALRKIGFKNLGRKDIENVIKASYRNLRQNGGNSQVTGQGETMASKKMSERRQEKNRINNVLDEVGGIIYGNKEYAKKQRLKREAERKELAKEIYSSVLKGDFNDVTLSQIDKFIEDATPANPFGRRISQRLPQRMERALRQGARANAVDALFSRISESAVPANERFSEAGRRKIEERKKELLKGWAIATGNWHTDLKEFTDDTEPIGEGKDSKVYSSKDGRYVIKASKGKPFGKRFRPDIDNIALFNDVFRDTRYEILGYGEIDGEFVRILQQPIVDFAGSTPLTSEERREYMQSLGFEPLNDANTAFADGEIVIADLQKGNIVRDAAGNISVIDADAKLHTKDVGGDYTYPPVETDLPEGTDLSEQRTMFSKVTPEMDSEYMAAVENGDMETAERLVKEAAKLAMPDTKVVDEDGYPMPMFHGDRKKGRYKFSTDTFFTPNEQYAKRYTGGTGEVYPVYLNIEKPFDVRDNEAREIFTEFNSGNAPVETTTGALDWGQYTYEDLQEYIEENYPGEYDGFILDEGGEPDYNGNVVHRGLSYIPFTSNQAKYSSSVTYDNNGNVIPLSERFNEEKEDIRFRRANKNQDIFVSNAQRAVEGIKQEKATPEQWIAMLKNNGGLKAGEEAWLGLEEWLNEKQGAVTKQEILDFIGANKIQIEEVEYAQFGYGLMDEATRKLETELKEIGWDAMVEKYPGFDELFEVYDGELLWSEERASVGEYEDFIIDNKIVDLDSQSNAINETRGKYTTEGLERKREIALTVPTVEPYNASDEVHFGDAGNGRAVAWVRFGETTDSEGNRVLVIDEIQSKRHQDGREKGYKNPNAEVELEKAEDAYREAIKAEKAYNAELKEKYGYDSLEGSLFQRTEQFINSLTEEEKAKRNELKGEKEELAAAYDNLLKSVNGKGVPSAPFEKNWHELAMKRMLRLAAEEGFDKVAWTTGEQQAERYDMSKVVSHIECDKVGKNGNKSFSMGLDYKFIVDPNGIVISSKDEYVGKSLADIVGKPLANKMLEMQEGDTISGDGLRIGGEGMKGFYDRMLPSFVQKYTKKWGAKVGEVTMPNLSENNTMHSVDVTPEMQESVMEGQTMFSKKITYDEAVQIGNDFAKTHKGAAKKMVFSKGAAEVEQQMRDAGFTELSIKVVLEDYKSGDLSDAVYLRSSDGIVFYKYLTDTEVYVSLWHENGHRAMRMIYGDDLSEVERVFNTLPDDIRNEKIEELEERGYTKEEFPKETVCYFIQDAYTIGVLDNAKVDLTDFGKAYPDMKDFANFVQQIINYTRHGEGNEDFVSKAEGEFSQGKINTRLQERDARGREEGAGAAETATEGLTEEVNSQEGETLFSKKKLTPEQQRAKQAVLELIQPFVKEKREEHADELITKMRENAELHVPRLLTEEVWKNEIEGKTFQSPVGPVKLGENQFDKNKGKGREKEFGMIIPTLERPDLIFEEFDTEDDAERQTKYVFAKAFYDSEGNKHVYYADVSVLKNGMEAVTSSHHLRPNQLRKKIKEEHLLWNRFASDSSSSAQGSSTDQNNAPSADKGSISSAEMQEGETLFSKKELTPEQKKKQKALKENAKAIRRLHNVKSNYPITALRNLGFALETQEQREEHNRLFAERDAISGRQNTVSAEVNPQSMTLMERITESLMKAAVQNKENVDMRLSAIRAYGRDLSNVLKLMRAQRGYDRNTVRMFTNLVKMYLRNNSMSGMSSYDITRLLGLIERANGGYGPQVMRAAEQIAEIITKSHTRELENIVRKQIKTGAEKVNASGVVVQGGVDIIGKRVLNTFRDAINMTTEEEFEKAYKEAFERAHKFPNDAEAKAVCDAMVIAKEYRDNIADRKAQEKELQKSIGYYSDIRQKLENGEISRKEYNEFVDSVRRSIVELRAQMVDDYQKIIHALGGDITEGIARAKAFRERELARIENIRNMADADMEGVSKSAERKKRGKMGKSVDYITYKNPLLRLIMTGMGTYNEFMKFFGRNAIGGKGRLYDYFIGRYTEAQNQEWKEKQADIKKMEDKCEEIFGKDFISVMRGSTKNSGVVLEYWNGGERVSRELSIGQLMYIYMTAKQTDGEMKLRGMGITEETVNRAVSVLPATYKAYADWVQSEFLPEMRPRMNKVHQRMFGASMSEVENYFPLVVNTDARQSEVDLNSVMPITPSTITGAVIKRKVNATPLDLEANAFDVLMNHVNDMEHWAAFAEFTRDNNTLIGDKDFMNRVKNSKDLRYGDGEKIWNDFVDCARITTGNYQSKKDYMSNIMKGTNSAKITFGYFTALKQFLSAPGLLTDASWRSVIKATANPMGSWKWAIENLPGFEERWKGRTAGNERLADSDNDWSIWDNRVVKAARELGMSPNAFVDAVVVSTGARAVYETRKKLYKSLGLPDADAHKRAQTDAAVAYNETQQSAQGAYLSILQKEGGFYAMVMTLFRNSQMAYGRKVTGSMAETVKKISRWNDILENTEKKYKDMGLSEEDAHKAANREMLQSTKKDVINLVLFGYVLNAIWALGEYIPYLIFGDDEEEKEKIMGDILKIGVTGMFEGFALGGFAKDLYIQGLTDSKYSVDMITTPFAEDFEKVYNRFKNDGTLAGLTQLLVLGAETTTGISPQRLIDDVAAVIDFCEGDLDTATEVELLTMRLAKVPQSQIDKIYMDEAIDGDVMKLAERFVEYKANREFFGIGVDKSKMADKYAKKFHKANKEDLEQIVQDENAFSGYYETLSPEDKARLAGIRRNYIKEQADVKKEEALTLEEKLQKILYGAKEQNLVYYEQSTTEDVDSEILIAIELSKYEDVYKEKEKLKGEEKAKFKKEHKKELDFYEDLKDNFNDISRYKSKMKESPEKAEYYMTKIRKEQTQAIELINDYNNE